MKKMHWLGVIATSLISASTLAGCSGDDAPPVNAGGTGNSTAGTGTSGTGTAGTGTGGSGTAGGSNMGVQLQPPAYYVTLTGADATAPAMTAPEGYTKGGCNACHDANAVGNVIGPEIRFTPKAYLTAVVRNGRNDPAGNPTAMQPIAMTTVSDAELDAVGTWLNGLPKPATGPGLYKAMCGNCHGPMTPTGGSAPITIQGATIANVDKFVRMGSGTDVADRKKYMPAYDTTLLTDAELTLIKTFIGAK